MNPLFLQIKAGGEAVLTEEPTEKTMSILELMTSGGIGGILIMVFLGILSIMAVYIFLERFGAIRNANKVDPNFMNNIKDMVMDGKLGEKGLPLVNIAQPYKSSGMMLTCWKDTGISAPEDLANRTLGVWFFGNEFPFMSWMSQLGISTEGKGESGVEVLKQGFNVDPLLQRQADCISTMTYNEYWQVSDAGVSPDELITFKYEDQGVATLEDGLYVLEDNLKDPEFVNKMERFVRASMKGWKWAEENPDAAAEIVLDNDASGAQTEEHQKRMMSEVAKLTAGSNGALSEADYQRTVKTLLDGGSSPVITKEPVGAWTHIITDAALK